MGFILHSLALVSSCFQCLSDCLYYRGLPTHKTHSI